MNPHTSLLTLALALSATAASAATAAKSGYPISNVKFTDVKISPSSFWGQRIDAARKTTVPLAFSKCESEGRYSNFVKAAHPSADYKVREFMGYSFDDTDVYKTLEGASYLLQTFPDKRLDAYMDSVIAIVAAAQEPDGYLYTARTINPQSPHPWAGHKRWEREEELSHELYNLGHLVDAAVAHHQATGKTSLLDIARKYADCVCREVGRGQGQARVVPGHQIAEMALSRLYLDTGERRYLDEAKYLLDERGRTAHRDEYSQSHKPVTEQSEAVGHAVRAGYMYSGMADVAALTGDSAYIKAIDRIYQNITTRKYYITGGVGARHGGEAFGYNYELPNLTAYNETCAAISMVYLFHRMFMLHGQSQYIDALERTLYNGVISGMSADGGRFFYPNPLAADGHYKFNADGTTERQPWFGCACCPSNLCRFIPSVPGYVYAAHGRNLYVNLFVDGTASINIGGKKPVSLTVSTAYPYSGEVGMTVNSSDRTPYTIKIRIPGWARGEATPGGLYTYTDGLQKQYSLTLNGKKTQADGSAIGTLGPDGYYTITRRWSKGDRITLSLDMTPRMVKADRRVEADRNRVAFERGPLVYCAEGADNAGDIFRFVAAKRPQITEQERNEVFGKVVGLTVSGTALTQADDGTVKTAPATLSLIPYYAWNHRGTGTMAVWIADRPEGVGVD